MQATCILPEKVAATVRLRFSAHISNNRVIGSYNVDERLDGMFVERAPSVTHFEAIAMTTGSCRWRESSIDKHVAPHALASMIVISSASM